MPWYHHLALIQNLSDPETRTRASCRGRGRPVPAPIPWPGLRPEIQVYEETRVYMAKFDAADR
jgi:hypothetical protein